MDSESFANASVTPNFADHGSLNFSLYALTILFEKINITTFSYSRNMIVIKHKHSIVQIVSPAVSQNTFDRKQSESVLSKMAHESCSF